MHRGASQRSSDDESSDPSYRTPAQQRQLERDKALAEARLQRRRIEYLRRNRLEREQAEQEMSSSQHSPSFSDASGRAGARLSASSGEASGWAGARLPASSGEASGGAGARRRSDNRTALNLVPIDEALRMSQEDLIRAINNDRVRVDSIGEMCAVMNKLPKKARVFSQSSQSLMYKILHGFGDIRALYINLHQLQVVIDNDFVGTDENITRKDFSDMLIRCNAHFEDHVNLVPRLFEEIAFKVFIGPGNAPRQVKYPVLGNLTNAQLDAIASRRKAAESARSAMRAMNKRKRSERSAENGSDLGNFNVDDVIAIDQNNGLLLTNEFADQPADSLLQGAASVRSVRVRRLTDLPNCPSFGIIENGQASVTRKTGWLSFVSNIHATANQIFGEDNVFQFPDDSDVMCRVQGNGAVINVNLSAVLEIIGPLAQNGYRGFHGLNYGDQAVLLQDIVNSHSLWSEIVSWFQNEQPYYALVVEESYFADVDFEALNKDMPGTVTSPTESLTGLRLFPNTPGRPSVPQSPAQPLRVAIPPSVAHVVLTADAGLSSAIDLALTAAASALPNTTAASAMVGPATAPNTTTASAMVGPATASSVSTAAGTGPVSAFTAETAGPSAAGEPSIPQICAGLQAAIAQLMALPDASSVRQKEEELRGKELELLQKEQMLTESEQRLDENLRDLLKRSCLLKIGKINFFKQVQEQKRRVQDCVEETQRLTDNETKIRGQISKANAELEQIQQRLRESGAEQSQLLEQRAVLQARIAQLNERDAEVREQMQRMAEQRAELDRRGTELDRKGVELEQGRTAHEEQKKHLKDIQQQLIIWRAKVQGMEGEADKKAKEILDKAQQECMRMVAEHQLQRQMLERREQELLERERLVTMLGPSCVQSLTVMSLSSGTAAHVLPPAHATTDATVSGIAPSPPQRAAAARDTESSSHDDNFLDLGSGDPGRR